MKKREKVVSRTERAMRKRAGPIVVRKVIEYWELQPEYASSGMREESRKFMERPVNAEEGAEDAAYNIAAHILVHRKYPIWESRIYKRGELSFHIEVTKERLARWLKWHDKIRKEYVAK